MWPLTLLMLSTIWQISSAEICLLCVAVSLVRPMLCLSKAVILRCWHESMLHLELFINCSRNLHSVHCVSEKRRPFYRLLFINKKTSAVNT